MTDLPEAAYIQPPQLRIRKSIHREDNLESIDKQIQPHREGEEYQSSKQDIQRELALKQRHKQKIYLRNKKICLRNKKLKSITHSKGIKFKAKIVSITFKERN